MRNKNFTEEIIAFAHDDVAAYNEKHGEGTTTIFQTPTEQKISHWLYSNKDLPEVDRVKQIKGMLEELAPESLFNYAVSVSLSNCTFLEMINVSMAAVSGNWNINNNLHAQVRSDTGKIAADNRHSKAGGSRDLRGQIKAIWATGKYTSRDICAEQECAALNMSFSTARKALRNTPNPT